MGAPVAGYTTFTVGSTGVTARTGDADAVRAALGSYRSLHDWAAAQPRARALEGRTTAYATALSNGTRVVVRHAQHGGLLARITGDLFLPPTRAPIELLNSARLRDLGVATPAIVAFALYPVAILMRSDVAVEEIEDAEDLPAFLESRHSSAAHESGLAAVDALLESLAAARARHEDLNLKNILIQRRSDDEHRAWVIDVDRVRFDSTSALAGVLNARRLARSVIRWRERGLDISDNLRDRWIHAARGSAAATATK